MLYTVKMIHPNASADHVLVVLAESQQRAENLAREHTRRTYGPGHMFMVGGSERAR